MIWDGTIKREVIRATIPCRIILHNHEGDTIDTTTINLSEGGVGITLKKELQLASEVSLEIHKVTPKAIACKGIIKWVNKVESAYTYFYNIGIKFTQIKDRDLTAIKKFVASIASNKK